MSDCKDCLEKVMSEFVQLQQLIYHEDRPLVCSLFVFFIQLAKYVHCDLVHLSL